MKLHNIMKLVNDTVKSSSEAFVAVLDEEGFPHVSQRSLIYPESSLSLYFSSDRNGNLHRRIASDGKTGLCFYHTRDNITLTGRTVEITDREEKKKHWLDWFINHYPGGPEGNGFVLFRFTTERLSLWVDGNLLHLDRKEIAAPLSYCGLYCSHCEFRESHGCSGCHTGKGRPFWGNCPVADCCRKKGLAHCGDCPVFPCETLRGFSCGEGEHCDTPRGSRLDVLRMWHG